MSMPVWVAIIGFVVLFIVGFGAGIVYRRKVSEKEISSAEDEAKRIINEAIKNAENKKRETLLEAKEEIHRNRSEYEREVRERRTELQKQERRLQQKEEMLDKKTEQIESKNEQLNRKIAEAEEHKEEIVLLKRSQLEMLEKISGYTVEEAKEHSITTILVQPQFPKQSIEAISMEIPEANIAEFNSDQENVFENLKKFVDSLE